MKLDFPHRALNGDSAPPRPLHRVDLDVLLSLVGGSVSTESLAAFRVAPRKAPGSLLDRQIHYFASNRPRSQQPAIDSGSFCPGLAIWGDAEEGENRVYQSGLGNIKAKDLARDGVSWDQGQDIRGQDD